MRNLLLISIVFCSLCGGRAQAISAEDLATREGEFIFGQAWLKKTRERLNERVDPFCIDVLETWLIRLKNQFELGSLPVTALCLNGTEFNAFAAPGGIIGVNRGIYLDLSSESEVMAVLAHELAHLSQRHHYRSLRNSERISTGTIATLAGIVAAIATHQGQATQSLIVGGQAANATSALAYSRDYEREADRLGIAALGRAGYRPEAMSKVLKILADKQSQSSKNLAFLSTHPLGIERQSDLDARISQLKGYEERSPVLSDPDFQFFRCLQTEGLEPPINRSSNIPCSSIHSVLRHYRAGNYREALVLFDRLPTRYKETFSGLDIEIALTLKTGDLDRTESAIDTVALFFPSWLQPAIARVDLAIAQSRPILPRGIRERMIQRPERLDLWRALDRFAQAFEQEHFLFEARGWDALLHGQFEVASIQLERARASWPKMLGQRPLDLLGQAIKQGKAL